MCIFTIDESEELITSPGFPGEYDPNQNCVYNIVNNAEDGCIRLNFLYFELTPRVQGACRDYLTVSSCMNNCHLE